MPIFTQCNFDSPIYEQNNPVNLMVCCMVLKSEKYTGDEKTVILPTIKFVTETKTIQWVFASEQDRDAEFERILSI